MMAIKNLLKITVSLIALVLLPVGSWAACTGSSPTWYSTPDYSSVYSCVSQASAGDTINVSAGSATWTNALCLTNSGFTYNAGRKGINLIGAGIGNTVITFNQSETNYGIIYEANSNDEYLRISGFTFNMNDKAAIHLKSSSEPTVPLIRIDHNRFTNSTFSGSCVASDTREAFGVIDNNVIDDVKYPFRVASGGQATWNAYGDDFWGTGLSLYIEDNVIRFSDYDWPVTDGDFGGKWVIRYNTITVVGHHYSFTDLHGGRGSFEGGMGAELYGNYIDSNGYEIHALKTGGGRTTAHHNNIIGTSSAARIKLSENGYPSVKPVERQLMNNSYHFQNRSDTTGALVPDVINLNSYNTIRENEAYWMDNERCVGGCSSISSGVGCGSTLPTHCTPSSDTTKGSTAFWLTNQSCTSLSGLTGASTGVSGGNRNSSSIIEGTLYICTASDTWTKYYTPYTYPHPLRVDTTSPPPSTEPPSSPPPNLRIIP